MPARAAVPPVGRFHRDRSAAGAQHVLSWTTRGRLLRRVRTLESRWALEPGADAPSDTCEGNDMSEHRDAAERSLADAQHNPVLSAEQSFTAATVHALLAIEQRLGELLADLQPRVPLAEPR